MSNHSDTKRLRDELARSMAEVRKRNGILEQQRIQNEQQRIQNEQLRAAGQGGGGRGTRA